MAARLEWHTEIFGAETIQELVEGIYDSRPALARKILRSRILTDREPTMAEKELVRVAAKRWSLTNGALPAPTHELRAPELAPPPELPEPWRPGTKIESSDRARELLSLLVARTRRENLRYASDRPVAAILVAGDGTLLAAELNTNARVRTRHAEMNLLLRRGAIPAGATLYVSLKPCAMCAARIWEEAQDLRRLKVVYFEDDPGKLARNTILMRGSPARVRFLGKHHALYPLDVQSPA